MNLQTLQQLKVCQRTVDDQETKLYTNSHSPAFSCCCL